MTSNTQTGKRSFGRRILWILRTAFVSLLLVVVLAGLAWAAFWGTQELTRSFDSMAARIDANKQRIALLNDEVAELKAGDPTDEISQLQAESDALAAQLAALQEQMTADLAHQSEMLAALQTDLAAAAATGETAAADTAALNEAFLALQNDINESNGRIDNLGGEFDTLQARTEGFASRLAQFEETAVPTANLEAFQQTLSLFHIWEQISRARLHLADNNEGLAASEVEQALRMMDILTANSAPEDAETLSLVQTRLSLALNSLPDDAETAVRDLENAWDQLDAMLTAQLFPEAAVPAAPAGETEEAAPTPTPTPTS